jgi:hypothetical protein
LCALQHDAQLPKSKQTHGRPFNEGKKTAHIAFMPAKHRLDGLIANNYLSEVTMYPTTVYAWYGGAIFNQQLILCYPEQLYQKDPLSCRKCQMSLVDCLSKWTGEVDGEPQ